jgi:hypothetical protein
MRRLFVIVCLVASPLAFPAPLWATPLPPNSIVSTNQLATLPVGTFVAPPTTSSLSAVDAHGHTTFAGFVVQAVYKESSGNLDFLYQVQRVGTVGSADITALNVTNFGSFATSASYLRPSAQVPSGFFVPSTMHTPIPVQAQRDSGPTVTALFNPPASVSGGTTSLIFDVQTNAKQFTTGGSLVLVGGGSDSHASPAPAFAPVPEPASLVLLSGCLLGLGVHCGWRRRKAASDAN